jgi:hypothetical protein
MGSGAEPPLPPKPPTATGVKTRVVSVWPVGQGAGAVVDSAMARRTTKASPQV